MFKKKNTPQEVTQEDIIQLSNRLLNKTMLQNENTYNQKIKQDKKEIKSLEKRNNKAKNIISRLYK